MREIPINSKRARGRLALCAGLLVAIGAVAAGPAAALTDSPDGLVASTPKKIFVRNSLGADEDLTYRPHRFYLSADGTFGILGVKWKHYGARWLRRPGVPT